jgi:hypothetical protein
MAIIEHPDGLPCQVAVYAVVAARLKATAPSLNMFHEFLGSRLWLSLPPVYEHHASRASGAVHRWLGAPESLNRV